MAIITISEGEFSGGTMLAEAVSQRLGYRRIDHDQVIAKATQWGISEEELRTAIEKPPGFFGQSQHTKYRYLAFIQAALAQEVIRGNAVYHGLAGHLLLGKGQHVLRTRIIAPMVFRVPLAEYRGNCSRKEAITHIDRTDEDYRKWTRFLYDVDWTDPLLYDLVINLEQMTLVEACDAICLLAERGCFQTTPDTQADLGNLALASWIKASLAMNAETCDLQFEIAADNGSVSIKGAIDTPGQASRIRGLIANIPGVAEVRLHELSLVTRI